ncbi:uncharacterized protein LOC106465054 isoform X1 [Limulus polyphemus]|uniref:Neuroendocrine protein 7B2 n=1 Tax=Limulus polyphemus TaxID=6850 RepID=A0ABM1BF28_LIMPO|nr:uncharacterized protein LOC106465054 isoform X1 [Limulus polyphemus]
MEISTFSLLLVICACTPSGTDSHGASFDGLNTLTDSLLQEVMARMQGFDNPPPEVFLPVDDSDSYMTPSRVAKQYEGHKNGFHTRQELQGILGREPSLRDQEKLQHSSLWGHQYMQGGAGEGAQHLKPDGSVQNNQEVKTDAVLPAYCTPPNPCPIGYTAEDGCLEDFVNTAAFSREYQSSQDCMCDAEHMFGCPTSTQDNELDALAQSIQNQGLMDSTLNRIVQNMQIEGEHKTLVAKKFFNPNQLKPKTKMFTQRGTTLNSRNPYLKGEKLPVVAKKG